MRCVSKLPKFTKLVGSHLKSSVRPVDFRPLFARQNLHGGGSTSEAADHVSVVLLEGEGSRGSTRAAAHVRDGADALAPPPQLGQCLRTPRTLPGNLVKRPARSGVHDHGALLNLTKVAGRRALVRLYNMIGAPPRKDSVIAGSDRLVAYVASPNHIFLIRTRLRSAPTRRQGLVHGCGL